MGRALVSAMRRESTWSLDPQAVLTSLVKNELKEFVCAVIEIGFKVKADHIKNLDGKIE